jgi:hypothetical protein
MGQRPAAEQPAIREYPCQQCSAMARGVVAKPKWDRSFYAQFHDAGFACSACGIFLCQAHRDQACKDAKVSTKDCPVCGQKKAWNGVLTSPACEPQAAVSGECVVCSKPVEGKVLTPEETSALPMAEKVPRAWMCYHCGALLCQDHLVATVACPTCGSLRPFTGLVTRGEAMSKDLGKTLARIMSDADEWRKPDDKADRERYAVALDADRSDILAWADTFKREPLAIARLVELGRDDLATDDVIDRLASADPPHIQTLGRVAVATQGARAVDAVEAATRSPSVHVRAVALSYLADFRKDPRATRFTTGLGGPTLAPSPRYSPARRRESHTIRRARHARFMMCSKDRAARRPTTSARRSGTPSARTPESGFPASSTLSPRAMSKARAISRCTYSRRPTIRARPPTWPPSAETRT